MGERKVKKSLIRKIGGSKLKHSDESGGDDDGDFERGDKVEARYGGESKWYKGKISTVNRDGTYDVLYEDGDKERKVKKSLIRRLGGGKKKSSKKPWESDADNGSDDDDGDFERGDKVEARYGGKTKWYKGKISMVRSDGTYDVLYEDGDKERNVKKSLIRKIGGRSSGK